MRVTILTQYYPPEAGAPQRRLSDLAIRLRDRGHTVQVLTALPNYPGENVFPEFQGKGNEVRDEDGIRVARVNLYVPPLQKTVSQRLRCYFSFGLNAAVAGRRLLDRTDVLFMESPPLTIAPAGVMLSRSLGVPLVCNVSDLWPQSAVELGMLRPGVMLRLAEWLERWTYEKSAALTGQTNGICDQLRADAPGKMVHLFPNGVALEAYAAAVDVPEVRASFGWRNDELIAGYTGLLGHAQALSQVVEAGRFLSADDRIRIVLFGDGPCRKELETSIQRLGLGATVTLYPAQPASRMPAIQKALDVGIVPLARQPIFDGARPSKMLEVMAAGRPVLFCGQGESAALLNSAPRGPAGIVVPPESPEDLAAALKRLAADPDGRARMGESGREMVLRQFDRRAIAAELEQFLERVVSSFTRRRARG